MSPRRSPSPLPIDRTRRALLGVGLLGVTAWTVDRSGALSRLSRIDSADASSPTGASATGSAATAAESETDVAAPVDGTEVAASGEALVAPGASRLVVYTPSTATRAFSGMLVRPPTDQRSTAVVLVHGGGATGGGRADCDPWAAWYRDHGYLTFAIDYRLVDPLVDHGIYPIPEQNTKAAVQFLRLHATELGIERIVVQGHSAGARLGGIAVTTPDLPAFDGREVWTGVSDRIDGLIGFYGYYDGGQYEPVAYYGGSGSAPSTSVSTRRAAKASGPIYLLHGEADGIVGVNRTQAFADALRAAAAPVVLEVVPGQNHGYDGYGTAALTPIGLQTADRLAAWIEAHASA